MGTRWASTAAAVGLALGLLAAPSARAHALTYYGGPVMHSEQVVLVEWGSQVDSTFTNPASGDPGLFNYLASQAGTTTDIGGVLAQYGDNLGAGGALQNSANAVTYGGEYTIAPSVGAGGGTPAVAVDDSDIRTQLQNSISSGHLPPPLDHGLGTIYVILFPPGDQITASDGSRSGVDYCAYHDTIQTASGPLLYAVMPDDGGPNGDGSTGLFAPGQGCGVESTTIGNQTSTVAHELAETINDPEVGLDTAFGIQAPIAWYEDTSNGGEIADICDTFATGEDTTYAGTWTVQNLWSNADGVCEATEPHFAAPTAGTISPPTTVVAGHAASFSTTGTTDSPADTLQLRAGTLGPGIASYSWNWGDGSNPSSGAAPQHTYAQGGQHTVTVTVTDDLGFSAQTSTGITVYSGIPAVTTSTPATSIANTSATLPGTVNPNAAPTSYHFIFGLSQAQLSHATPVTDAGAGTTVESVSAIVSGLTPATTYYYELVGTANGTQYDGGVKSFTTTGTPPPPPAPVVSTSAASHLTQTGATLNGTVNPDGLTVSHRFAWGTSASSLTNLTPSIGGPTGRSAVPVQATLAGLVPGRTYYFELRATGAGKTVVGRIQSFRTLPAAPGVTSGSATKVRATSATLHGTVNPHGTRARYYFQYGNTLSYGHSTRVASAGTGTRALPVTAVLGGLRPNGKYHYRLVATGPGGTADSADRTFTTAASGAASSLPRLSFIVRRRPHTLSAIRVTFRCDQACSAGFGVIAELSDPAAAVLSPIALATGAARLRHAGARTITLRPTAAGLALAPRAHGLQIEVTGSAWIVPGLTRRPQVRAVTLR